MSPLIGLPCSEDGVAVGFVRSNGTACSGGLTIELPVSQAYHIFERESQDRHMTDFRDSYRSRLLAQKPAGFAEPLLLRRSS
jgi:hypothetical protein